MEGDCYYIYCISDSDIHSLLGNSTILFNSKCSISPDVLLLLLLKSLWVLPHQPQLFPEDYDLKYST